MKKIATFTWLACLFFCGNLSAQSDFPQGLKYYWSDGLDQMGQTYYKGDSMEIKDDSSSGGFRYFNARYKFGNRQLWAREGIDSPYHLIYNFHLQAGDTFKGYGPYDKLTIDSLGDIYLMGKWRKIQYLQAVPMIVGTSPYFTVIEGFGSMQAGIDYWRHFLFESHRNLMGGCNGDSSYTMFQTKVKGPHNIVVITDARCEDFQSQIQAISIQQLNQTFQLNAFPNPFQNKLTVQSNPFALIKIYDALGKYKGQMHANQDGQAVWNTGDWTPGLYLVQIEMQGNSQIAIKNSVLIKN